MELRVRMKIWVERNNRIALSGLRIQLLEAIAATGSLREASGQMGWPYRRAWGKIRELEESLGVPLIVTETGGYGGGGRTQLTDAAREFIRRYHIFADGLEELVRERFANAFGGSDLPIGLGEPKL